MSDQPVQMLSCLKLRVFKQLLFWCLGVQGVRLGFVCVIFSASIGLAQAQTAVEGDAGYLAGDVTYVRNVVAAVGVEGQIRVLAKGSPVYSGDRLITEDESYLQIEFTDESRLTIRPNSELLISRYYFDVNEPRRDTASFQLVKGGFYSETGLIGKRGNPDAYRVDSSVANIGVRGTRYSVYLCQANDSNCQQNQVSLDQNGQAVNGLYVSVSSGAVEVQNDAGTQTLSQGEYVFASDNFSSPIFIDQSPVQLGAIEPDLPLSGCVIGY